MHAVYTDERIKEYVLDLVAATRNRRGDAGSTELAPLIEYGASPRAAIFLLRAAKAHAFLRGRAYVTPDDVKALGLDVLRHRVILTYEPRPKGSDPTRCCAGSSRRCRCHDARGGRRARSGGSRSPPATWCATSSPANTPACSGAAGWSSPRCASTSRATTSAPSTGTSPRGWAPPTSSAIVEERELTVLFVVDLSASGGFGTRRRTKRELAAEIGAVLALAAARNNDRVGAALFTDRIEPTSRPPRAGATCSGSSAISLLRARRTGTDLARALASSSRRCAGGR